MGDLVANLEAGKVLRELALGIGFHHEVKVALLVVRHGSVLCKMNVKQYTKKGRYR